VVTSPILRKHKRHRVLKIYYIKKKKQNAIVGRTTGATTMGQECLITGVGAGVIGLLQVLLDDIHRLWDVAGHARIP
jgi:hypothetical protein